MGLDWHRFILAMDSTGKMLGCGQLKPHAGRVMELASIAVEAPFRNRGIARRIIEHLISNAPRPLYLTTRAHLGSFYGKWGFRIAEPSEMPTYFRRLNRVASLLSTLVRDDEGLLVMVLK